MKIKITLVFIFTVLFPCSAKAQLSGAEVIAGKFYSCYGIAYVSANGETTWRKFPPKGEPHKEFVKAISLWGAKIYWNHSESTEEYFRIRLVSDGVKDFEFCLLPEEEKNIKKIKDDPSRYKYEKGLIVNRYDKKGKVIGKMRSDWVTVKHGQIIILKLNESDYIAIRSLKLTPIFFDINKIPEEYQKRYQKKQGAIGRMIYEYRIWPEVISPQEPYENLPPNK